MTTIRQYHLEKEPNRYKSTFTNTRGISTTSYWTKPPHALDVALFDYMKERHPNIQNQTDMAFIVTLHTQHMKRLHEGTHAFPLTSFTELYHVGHLNQADKQMNSHEGSGLSVSQHPQAWREIAKLGDAPTYVLTKADNQFIDAHALSDALRQHIHRWAYEQGYIEDQTLYVVTYRDEQSDETYTITTTSASDAQAEIEALPDTIEQTFTSDDEYDNYMQQQLTACTQTQPVMTRKLANAAMHTHITPAFTDDLTLIQYVQECTSYDGVWFNDAHNIHAHTCERAVIVPTKLKEWHVRVSAYRP